MILDKILNLDEEINEGSIEGYITNTKKHEQLENYLNEQDCPNEVESLQKNYDSIAILKSLYINDEDRGEGHGSSLLQNFIANVEAKGAEAILLIADTSEDNEIDLVKWYEDYGFYVCAGKREYFPLMIKDLYRNIKNL